MQSEREEYVKWNSTKRGEIIFAYINKNKNLKNKIKSMEGSRRIVGIVRVGDHVARKEGTSSFLLHMGIYSFSYL